MKVYQICNNPYNTIYSNRKNESRISNVSFTGGQISQSLSKLKHSAIVAMFLLPSIGVISSCNDTKKDSQGVEYIDKKANIKSREDYIDKDKNIIHTVDSNETLYSISRKYDVDINQIKSANGIGDDNIIRLHQELKIPLGVNIKNVKTRSDVSKLTGLSQNYLAELERIENPDNIKTIFYDNNGNATVGAGHKLLKSEISSYKGREISDEEKYTLMAQDLLSKEDKIKEIIKPEIYDNLPELLRENVFDFVYHRGETAFKKNKPLVDGLNNEDYVKAVANLYKNYTMAKNSKGKSYEKHMAGLCKRSLIRMGNASKIFKNGIPEEVLKSAKSTYEEGLYLLKKETQEGKIPAKAYPNVLAEYQDIAYNLFDGKIGVKTGASKISSSDIPIEESSSPQVIEYKPIAPAAGSTVVYVDGQKISRTKQQIEADWANNAQRFARPFKRPELVLDKNGNVTAFVKVINPTGSGKLNNKVIIVNQGHGGCVANTTNLNNTNFDPGCSNAIMEPVRGNNGKFKRDKNGALILRESNKFIGNGGKALEEWKVNELFSNDLIGKLTSNGAKVIFISGEVHNAQAAIKKIETKNKIDCLISLHSNSSETIKTKVGSDGREYVSERITNRGFFIMPNDRNGIDKQDNLLAKSINKKFYEDTWLVGLGKIQPKSLAVLSWSKDVTSPVPGVLIETGNLKHESDVANLNSRDFRSRLIQATYEGIVEYLN